MAEYRWNQAALAEEFDRAAEYIHPHYVEIQDVILGFLYEPLQHGGLVVDAGGGSGRLAERILRRFDRASVLVVDQSAAFLDIAARRLQPFGARARVIEARLQADWSAGLPGPVAAIVSMSAIHHLDPAEKQSLYARFHDALAPGGVLLNGDEVRDPDSRTYKSHMLEWSAWKNQHIAEGRLSDAMAANWRAWEQRNIENFDAHRVSGDDCHETIAVQLDYFRAAGFTTADTPWQRDMWAVLRGRTR